MDNNLWEKLRSFILSDPKNWHLSCERKSVSEPHGHTIWEQKPTLTMEGTLGNNLLHPLTQQQERFSEMPDW